jgi:hypothetical protein
MRSSTTVRPPMFHPRDDVLAVIDDAARADAAIEALHDAGFDEAHIHVFRGRAEIEGLARSWWKHSGVPAFIAPFLGAFLSDEYDIEKRYESEGLAGHTVLAVHTGGAEDVKRAAGVLRDFAAHELWFFGRWTLTELWPDVARRAQRDGIAVKEVVPEDERMPGVQR